MVRMKTPLRALVVLGLLAASCVAPANPPAIASPTPPPTQPTTGSVAPTVRPVPTRYEASVFVSDASNVSALAVGDTQLFLAVNVLGARPGDTQSSIAAIPLLTGGGQIGTLTGPATLGGTQAIGMQVGGVAVFKNEVYFSRQFGPNARDSGVFRYSGNQLTVVAGGPGSPATLSPGGDGGQATAASLDTPAGIAFNAAADLFVAEVGAGRVRRVSGGMISTYAGRGPCGVIDPPTPGPATQTLLCGPELVAANATGDLYVTRRGWTWIAKVSQLGALTVINKFQASGLAVDANGALLATDGTSGRVVRFDATGLATTIADGLGIVSALAVGPDGSIYVLHSTAPSGTFLLKVTKLRPM